MRSLLMGMALLAGAGSAFAADMPIKAVQPLVTPQAWQGFYLGVHGAGAVTKAEFDFVVIPGTGNIHPTGYMAGGLVGVAAWKGSVMFALEADAAYDFSKSRTACIIVLSCEIKSGWFMTQRVVLGVTMGGATGAIAQRAATVSSQWPTPISVPSTLADSAVIPYITAGIAERRLEACIDLIGCGRNWLVGPTGGGGLRIPVSQAISFDVQYLYVNYNKHFTPSGGPMIFPAEFKAKAEHVARAGLDFHF